MQTVATMAYHLLQTSTQVWNVEDFNPDPFMEALNKWGLPWQETENPELVDLEFTTPAEVLTK